MLIVDKDSQARSEVAALLAAKGYVVRATGSGDEAVGWARKSPVACAIVDVAVEDADGLDVMTLLRDADPGIRLIATAAENTKDLEAKVRRLDVTYYYVKQFDREELLGAVDRAARGACAAERKKILVVDDDPDYQAAMKRLLCEAGYDVAQASTKEEGLEAVRLGNPDLVILDIMMAENTDGFHFLYEMKADRRHAKPPVLSVSCIASMTGFAFSPTGDEDYFPVDDYLMKPVESDVLLSHVEALLDGRRGVQQDR